MRARSGHSDSSKTQVSFFHCFFMEYILSLAERKSKVAANLDSEITVYTIMA